MSHSLNNERMGEPLRIRSGERSIDEIIDALDAGHRVIVETELLGSVHEVTLRRESDIYYCDTPTTLHRHETETEMRTCIAKHGYASD